MSKSNSVKKEKKIYQRWWVWVIGIILVVAGIYFVFGDDIKAYRMGINVQYLKDPKYCQTDSDCVSQNNCGSVNKYNYEDRKGGCEQTTCGISCNNNQCHLETNCIRVNENGTLERNIDGRWIVER